MPSTIWIPGNPIAWQRAQKKGRHHWTADETRRWQRHVRELVAEANVDRIERPAAVAVELWFFLPRPPSHRTPAGKLRRAAPRLPTSKPDFDNLAKSICDALGGKPKSNRRAAKPGVAWDDDAQVTDATVRKRWADGREPGVLLALEFLDSETCVAPPA